MIRKNIYIATLLLSLSSVLFGYDKDLELLYPEQTMLYGRVENVEKIAKNDPDHPISKLFKHPGFKNHVLKSKDKEKNEFMSEADAFLTKHCIGRVSFGILNLGVGEPENETTNTEDKQGLQSPTQRSLGFDPNFWSMVMTADCKATLEELDDFLEFIKESKSESVEAISKEDFEGVSYFIIEFKEEESEEGHEDFERETSALKNVYIALVEELLIVSAKEKDMKDFIGNVKLPNKDKTLADHPKYLDAVDKLKDYDVLIYARIDQMYETMIANKDTSLLNFIDDNPQAKMMVSSSAIKDDLHLDAFDSLYMGGLITEEGADMKFGISVKSMEGIAKLFQYDKFIPEMPKFAFEDYKSMNVSSYDFEGNYTQLEKLFAKVSPMGLMGVKMSNPELFKMAKENLFENLEPYYAVFSGHIDPLLAEEKAASQVYVGKVKNAALIYEGLEKLKEKKGGISIENFMGEKIYKKTNAESDPFYMAVVNNHLVFIMTSEDEMWKHVISQIKNPGKSIVSHKVLADMWASMPNGEVSMGYYDVAQIIRDQSFENHKYREEVPEVEDLKDLHYSIIMKSYQEDHSWYSYMKLKNYSPQSK